MVVVICPSVLHDYELRMGCRKGTTGINNIRCVPSGGSLTLYATRQHDSTAFEQSVQYTWELK